MKKYILLLLGVFIGYIGGLYTNYSLMEKNFALELAVNIAKNQAKKAENAAGQLSDIIRCYRDHHIGETDSIYEYAENFADSAVIEQYLSEYSFAY